MRVIITGALGFIGQNLLKHMVEMNYYIIAIDDFHDRPITQEEISRNAISFHYAIDYRDFDPLIDLSVDYIVHLGAISATNCWNLSEIYEKNLFFTQKIVKYSLEFNSHLIFASSASVYGNNYGKIALNENLTPAPSNLYAWSKTQSEAHILSSFKTGNPKFYILRFFNVWGPFEDHKGGMKSPVSNFSAQAVSNSVIKLFDSYKQYSYLDYSRDFISVESVVYNIILILENEISKSGIYNFGTGSSMSFWEIAQIVANELDSSIELISFPESISKHYQFNTLADITNATNVGFQLNHFDENLSMRRFVNSFGTFTTE